MANTPASLPRTIQSDLHDLADDYGERIAKGELVEIVTNKRVPNRPDLRTFDVCSCKRYSEMKPGKVVVFWDERDPTCKYVHLAPLQVKPYTVPL